VSDTLSSCSVLFCFALLEIEPKAGGMFGFSKVVGEFECYDSLDYIILVQILALEFTV
jgi:hypothetical protein